SGWIGAAMMRSHNGRRHVRPSGLSCPASIPCEATPTPDEWTQNPDARWQSGLSDALRMDGVEYGFAPLTATPRDDTPTFPFHLRSYLYEAQHDQRWCHGPGGCRPLRRDHDDRFCRRQ